MNTIQSSYKSTGSTIQLSLRNHVENNTKYTNKAIVSGQKWCAIAQLIIGIVSTVSGIITISTSRGNINKEYPAIFPQKCRAIDNSSYGVWSGMVYITTGVLGAYRRHNIKKIPCYIGFSVFSCVVSVSGIVIMMYYFAFCSGCMENDGLKAKVFFRFTSYAVLVLAHSNGMTFSIIGASLSCCGMECCNQSPTMEEFMSFLQDNTKADTLRMCPKPPSSPATTSAYNVTDITDVEQIYFEADNPINKAPLSYISTEEETEQKLRSKNTEKPSKRYHGVKLLPTK